MIKLFALLFAVITLPCFGGTSNDLFSPIPNWVVRETLHEDVLWSDVTKKKEFRQDATWYELDLKRQPTFQVGKNPPRVELLLLKARDPRIGIVPTDRDYGKQFFLPSNSDISNIFEKGDLRFRPSWRFNNVRITIPKIKIEKDDEGKKSLAGEMTFVIKF
jgi:hypothetical protein